MEATSNKGLLGKLMSAGKRVLTGESLFMTAFTNIGQGKRKYILLHLIPVRSFRLILIDLVEK